MECFNNNPLEFVRDVLYDGPGRDESYPQRGYIAPNNGKANYVSDPTLPTNGGMLFQFEYILPSNLFGDRVLIQWRYVTGNTCEVSGYDANFAEWRTPTLGKCDEPLNDTGDVGPERFWNCAETTIMKAEENDPTKSPAPSTISPTNSPTVSVIPTKADGGGDGNGSGDSRLIAYVGNWQECPTQEQTEHYTHIMIAFAVSYLWNANGNICDTSCTISMPPVCNNSKNPDLIQQWQSQGKKVLLSFGGAGMGGSWLPAPNGCWEHCFGEETKVVSQLTSIVNEMGLDGVDIDYEYYYDDGQKGSSFDKGSEARYFLKQVTVGLRESLKPDAIIIHVPMDSDMVPSSGYLQLLAEPDMRSAIDFLLPQYYNGIVKAVDAGLEGVYPGTVSALEHYNVLADTIFGGDVTKIVFGFCIEGCSGQATGVQAANIMSDLAFHHPCNGGAFFWVADDDKNGQWSSAVHNVIMDNKGCNSGPTLEPATSPPTISASPSTVPTTSKPSYSSPTTLPAPTTISTTCCPEGYTGLMPYNSCTQYYTCENGEFISGSTLSCPDGLLFDTKYNYCNWENDVTCQPTTCTNLSSQFPSTDPSISSTTFPSSVPSELPTVCKGLSKKKCKRNKEECKYGKGKINVCVAKEEANKDFCKDLAKSNGKKSKKCKKSELCRNKKVKNSCKGCHPLSCENVK